MVKQYVLDANVFIEAHRRYYAFDLCPGFWDCLLHYSQRSQVISIDRVKTELDGEDALGKWINHDASEAFVESSDTDVIAWYGQMADWVNNQPQFTIAALQIFATDADGWVIAYAKAKGCVVVTHEEFRPNIKKNVPIPNVCRAFNVEYENTFGMLKDLEASFYWREP